MSEKVKYNRLSFSGELLNPSFSIYMFELIHNEEDYFYYIGMTGDNYYPSARSAIHRLSGHFERAKKSTQNQLKVIIKRTLRQYGYPPGIQKLATETVGIN